MKANLEQQALEARKKVLEMIHKAGTSHIGSNFSCIDILATIFDHADFEKDELVVSKGWAAASVYYFQALHGLIPWEDLDRFCAEGEEKYIGLIEPIGVFGARFAGGSMGFGFPAAVGYALAKKIKGEEGKVYCLMSDGELNIGTTHEADLIAQQHELDNLVVLVDMNGFQAMGTTDSVLPNAFVGNGLLDGHNYDDIGNTLGKWGIFGFRTTKGKGVSFMENNNDWHYLHVDDETYQKAMDELCQS